MKKDRPGLAVVYWWLEVPMTRKQKREARRQRQAELRADYARRMAQARAAQISEACPPASPR